jgi:hypothetical protein
MHAVTLNQRPLDSLHALRVMPFLQLLSTAPPTFDPRAKAFHYVHSSTRAIAQLMMAGHVAFAIAMRDRVVRSVSLTYTGNKVWVQTTVEQADGSELQVPAADIAPGLDLALLNLNLPEITADLRQADRYLGAMAKLVYCAPEMLLDATRDGVRFRVRTDTPPVDAHLLATLDRALSRCGVQIVVFRISRIDTTGARHDVLEPAQIVERTQPLRPLAIQALGRFLHVQATPGISMR